MTYQAVLAVRMSTPATRGGSPSGRDGPLRAEIRRSNYDAAGLRPRRQRRRNPFHHRPPLHGFGLAE
jgi:hypothetical protein